MRNKAKIHDLNEIVLDD